MAASPEIKTEEASTASGPALTLPARDFNFAEFFLGHTRASGWFSDRFGKPRRHFCGDFYGSYKDGKFILDENLYYTDGVVEQRQWIVSITDQGIFSAESDSLIAGAHGVISGNTLSMRYAMKVMIEEGKYWDLDMRDQMILQPDGSLHNVNHVYKWGIRIGTVSAHYIHHDGSRVCNPENNASADAATLKAELNERGSRHLSSVSAFS